MAGFMISKSQLAAGYTGQLTPVLVVSGAPTLAIGEFVEPWVTGTDPEGLPRVGRLSGGTATNSIVGLVCGFEFDPSNLTDMNFTNGSGDRVAYVMSDPNILYEGDVSGTALTSAAIGTNRNVELNTVTISGGLALPGMLILSTPPTAATTVNLRITKILTGNDGVFGSRAQFRVNYSAQQMGTKSHILPATPVASPTTTTPAPASSSTTGSTS